MPTAVRLFLKQVVLEKGIPFDLKLPNQNDKSVNKYSIEYFPAKPALLVSSSEYFELVRKVPQGQVTRQDDIYTYLAEKHKVERITLDIDFKVSDFIDEVPIWRVLSTRGVLGNTLFCSREMQKEKLEKEGLCVVTCGAYGRSLMVKDFKMHLFDFHKVKWS